MSESKLGIKGALQDHLKRIQHLGRFTSTVYVWAAWTPRYICKHVNSRVVARFTLLTERMSAGAALLCPAISSPARSSCKAQFE